MQLKIAATSSSVLMVPFHYSKSQRSVKSFPVRRREVVNSIVKHNGRIKCSIYEKALPSKVKMFDVFSYSIAMPVPPIRTCQNNSQISPRWNRKVLSWQPPQEGLTLGEIGPFSNWKFMETNSHHHLNSVRKCRWNSTHCLCVKPPFKS